MRQTSLFSHKELNLGRISDSTCQRSLSVFFRVERYFDFIAVAAESAILQKHPAQNGRTLSSTIAEGTGDPDLIQAQVHPRTFRETQVSNPIRDFSHTRQNQGYNEVT